MTATSWSWNGARWWKVDFHTHTPASEDYGKGRQQKQLQKIQAKEWLLDFMRAGIDCVAVTDHNTGAWVDELQAALRGLIEEKPEGYRPLHLFPGVEISVQVGIHVLAILESGKTTSDVDSLLGAVGFPPEMKGSSDAVTSKSFQEVVFEIAKAGGIAIPAHVDSDNGLFKLRGPTLEQALKCEEVFAMEVVDTSAGKPVLYTDKKLRWTEVLGSDSHHPRDSGSQKVPGSRFTWVKMGPPDLQGLRLALLDGPLSVLRSDSSPADPNEHGPLALESIEVSQAYYMGRSEPFTVGLNPWLNTIVGGRGTGKSTLVELARLALRRIDEVPEELRPELEKYWTIRPSRTDGGLLTEDTEIRVVYRKNGSRFRLQWSPSGDLDAIQEAADGDWRSAQGDITQRFPIRLYSQKQVFHLAKKPLALLRIVDEAPEVDRRSWSNRWREEEYRFLSLRAKAREIEAGLEKESRLKGELDDVKRKLEIFEEAGHADVLRSYQQRRRQQRAVETWEETWADAGEQLRQVASDLVPDPLEVASLDVESDEDATLLASAAAARDRLDTVRASVEELAATADGILSDWQQKKDESSWKRSVDSAIQAYESLRERLADGGAGDPSAYGELVQRRQTIEQRLEELDERKEEVKGLRREAAARLTKLRQIRRELTERRERFLQSVLKDNRHVRIQVVPYGARDTVEAELRQILQREGPTYAKDIGDPEGGGLLGMIYANGGEAEDIEKGLEELKQRVREIAAGAHDSNTLGHQWFETRLRELQPEAFDRLDLWFPEDSLKIRYSPTGDGRNLRSIQEGSPGQRTAALLAFLLSYGDEPLVLDQPEDDLDNHLIYDLIVTQLREVKQRRQVVVVTHNPNIVVNGDAELVVALKAACGETHTECEGSLQDKPMRNTICEVMEGGRKAFEERYRRIALEGRHV